MASKRKPIKRLRTHRSYAMENPLSSGQVVMAMAVGMLGYAAVDMLDRWLTPAELLVDIAKQVLEEQSKESSC